MQRQRIGIIYGGKSAEHEISVRSAKNVLAALDATRFIAVPILIGKDGMWHLDDDQKHPVVLVPGSGDLLDLKSNTRLGKLNAAFPVLHGPLGEDGSIQGLLKLCGIPFVGADVLGSAIGMDKGVMKRLLREAGLPIGAFREYWRDEQPDDREITFPCFIKPANMGSSVGVAKAHDAQELQAAVRQAFRYDEKILIEEFIAGEEVECAVLGNQNPRASLPGRILPRAEFYSYHAKYLDENGAVLEIPAKLSNDTIVKIQDLAIRTFKALECSGMGRVDMFLQPNGEVLVNEINTIPGFTDISMYPKLWEASGLRYRDLITRLIELALERHERQSRLQTSYS